MNPLDFAFTLIEQSDVLIPSILNKMLSEETVKLAKMEDELAKRVIGQKTTIKAVSNAVRRRIYYGDFEADKIVIKKK